MMVIEQIVSSPKLKFLAIYKAERVWGLRRTIQIPHF